MPKLEQLINQLSNDITRLLNEPLWKSKTDLDYPFGEIKFSKKTIRHCKNAINGRYMNEHYRFEERFHGLSDISTLFHEKIDRKLNYQTPLLLDVIITLTRVDKKKHQKKLFTKLDKLQETRQIQSEWEKSSFFFQKTNGLGHEKTKKLNTEWNWTQKRCKPSFN